MTGRNCHNEQLPLVCFNFLCMQELQFILMACLNGTNTVASFFQRKPCIEVRGKPLLHLKMLNCIINTCNTLKNKFTTHQHPSCTNRQIVCFAMAFGNVLKLTCNFALGRKEQCKCRYSSQMSLNFVQKSVLDSYVHCHNSDLFCGLSVLIV